MWEEYDHPSGASYSIATGLCSCLAALLALGALFERRTGDSELLYQAAKASYLDILELGTLHSVQLAMQMAVFEINTSRSKALWSTLATAIRLSHYLVRARTSYVASLTSGSSKNLHRKPVLIGKSPDEQLRRCQLWYNSLVHDCWLSVSSGRPCLVVDGDCDLDPPWLPSQAKDNLTSVPMRQVSSPIFAMRIHLSWIWTKSMTKDSISSRYSSALLCSIRALVLET